MNRHHEVQAYHKVKEMIEAIDALLFGFLDSYSRVIMVRIFKSNHDIRDASRNSVYWGRGDGLRVPFPTVLCPAVPYGLMRADKIIESEKNPH